MESEFEGETEVGLGVSRVFLEAEVGLGVSRAFFNTEGCIAETETGGAVPRETGPEGGSQCRRP